VLATASGKDGVSFVRHLGADLTVDGKGDDIEAVARALAPDGIDAILAFVGGPSLTRCLSTLRRGGRVAHTYYDHVSILKFIERNWGLKPLSTRSRDNLPNPVMHEDDPYVPRNMPAIGDLMDLFDHHDSDDDSRGRG